MAARVFITGRVQGVGFRAFVREIALDRGVRGWVRNLDDGRVEAHLEGDDAALSGTISALRDGPPAGRVDDLAQETRANEGCDGFAITG